MKRTAEKERAQIAHDEIANLAKEIWQREGRQTSRDLEYWLRAEQSLRAHKSRSGNDGAEATASPSRRGQRSSPKRIVHI